MSARARAVLPVAAGLAVAAIVFAAVLLVTRGERTDAAAAPAPAAATRADARAGRLVFARVGCGSCHRLAAAGSSGQIGPPLDQVLPGHTAASLRAKILRPGPGTMMPGDFGRRMSAADLRALVAFLLAARGGTASR